jgi:hypothetical protein
MEDWRLAMENESIVKTLNESYKKLDEVFSTIEDAMSYEDVVKYSEALFSIKSAEQTLSDKNKNLNLLRHELENIARR